VVAGAIAYLRANNSHQRTPSDAEHERRPHGGNPLQTLGDIRHRPSGSEHPQLQYSSASDSGHGLFREPDPVTCAPLAASLLPITSGAHLDPRRDSHEQRVRERRAADKGSTPGFAFAPHRTSASPVTRRLTQRHLVAGACLAARFASPSACFASTKRNVSCRRSSHLRSGWSIRESSNLPCRRRSRQGRTQVNHTATLRASSTAWSVGLHAVFLAAGRVRRWLWRAASAGGP